jgi:hypothetical protein
LKEVVEEEEWERGYILLKQSEALKGAAHRRRRADPLRTSTLTPGIQEEEEEKEDFIQNSTHTRRES